MSQRTDPEAIDSLLILHETLQFFEFSFENPELKLFFLENFEEN
jgi:hypothetical protein